MAHKHRRACARVKRKCNVSNMYDIEIIYMPYTNGTRPWLASNDRSHAQLLFLLLVLLLLTHELCAALGVCELGTHPCLWPPSYQNYTDIQWRCQDPSTWVGYSGRHQHQHQGGGGLWKLGDKSQKCKKKCVKMIVFIQITHQISRIVQLHNLNYFVVFRIKLKVWILYWKMSHLVWNTSILACRAKVS